MDSAVPSTPDTPPTSSTSSTSTTSTTSTTATTSYPAYLSMYSKGSSSSLGPAAEAVQNMESEKLRKIRRRKELKEYRKYTKVLQYKTLGDDKNYNLAAVLESLESSKNMANHNNSTNNSGNNSNNNNNNNHHHASKDSNSVCNSNSSSNGGHKDSKKDKRGRRPITRRRSNQAGGGNNGGNNNHSNNSTRSVKRSNSTNEASSSSEENGLKDDEEEEEEDKMSSSSLVGGGALEEDEDPLFSKPNHKLERGLSKSSENLSHYSSDNLSSFTKVTNKKQKWKKKNAHSVEMPDHFNNNNSNNGHSSIGKGGNRPGSSSATTSSFYNGYNLRNREVEPPPPRPDIDLNARDFPPLDSRVEEITPLNCSSGSSTGVSPSWSKHAPLSSVSSSSSSSVMNERDEEHTESQQKIIGDLPDVTVREPPPTNSNATTRNHLPDLTAQAVEAARSSGETPSPPQEAVEENKGGAVCEEGAFIRKVGDIAIALTEEEYRRQDPSIPVVIFGRSSSAIRDWTSKSDNFEFGFEVNESLLAMSSTSSSPSSESSHPPQTHQIRSPPDAENVEVLPLDRIDRAILSFGDSVTNLTVLGDETSAESPQPDDSIHVPPYVEEPVTFNYNEVINYLESAWLESLKDKQPQCHPVASSAY